MRFVPVVRLIFAILDLCFLAIFLQMPVLAGTFSVPTESGSATANEFFPDPEPSIIFSASPTSGIAPLAVTFIANTQKGTVNFGDNAPSASLVCAIGATVETSITCSITHTYTANGTFTATLQIPRRCPKYPSTNSGGPSCTSGIAGQIAITVTSGGAKQTRFIPNLSPLSEPADPQKDHVH